MAEQLSIRVGADTGLARRAFTALGAELRKLGDTATRAGRGFNTWVNAMDQAADKVRPLRDLGNRLAIASAGGAALGVTFVTAAAKMERMRLGLMAVSGSAQEAERNMATLEKLMLKPSFGAENVMKGFQSLRTVGFSVEETVRIMEAAGDAITVLGGTESEVDGVITALTEISNKGRVSSEELQQLGERGIGALSMLRQEFNLTTADMNDLGRAFESRGLTANQVILRLADILKSRFGPAAEGAGDTATNAFQNFNTALFQARAALGENLLGPVKTALSVMTDFLNSVRSWSPEMKGAANTALVAGTTFSGMASGMLHLGASIAQIKLAHHIITAGKGAGLLATALTKVKTVGAAVFSPTGAIVTGLTIAIGLLVKMGKEVKNAFDQARESSKSLDEMVQRFRDSIRSIGDIGDPISVKWGTKTDLAPPPPVVGGMAGPGSEELLQVSEMLRSLQKYRMRGGLNAITNADMMPSGLVGHSVETAWTQGVGKLAEEAAAQAFQGKVLEAAKTYQQLWELLTEEQDRELDRAQESVDIQRAKLELMVAQGRENIAIANQEQATIGRLKEQETVLRAQNRVAEANRVAAEVAELQQTPARREKEVRDRMRDWRREQLDRKKEMERVWSSLSIGQAVYGLGGESSVLGDILAPARRAGKTHFERAAQKAGQAAGNLVNQVIDERFEEFAGWMAHTLRRNQGAAAGRLRP